MATQFSVFSAFRAIDGVSKPIKTMRRNVIGFSNTTQKSLLKTKKSYISLGAVMSRVLPFIGITSAIFAMKAGMTSLISTGADFEKTMVSATVKFPGNIRKGTKAFKELERVVRRSGATTEFTATQAAKGIEFLALAGFSAKQAIALLPGTLDLATSAGIELGRASDIASDTLSAFGLMTKDTSKLTKNFTRVLDVMAQTSTSANTNMEQLFETFIDSAPVATALGQSIETVSALAGILANAGIKASKAGTTLKNVFINLTDTGGQSGTILKRLGVQVKDSNGDLRDTIDIIADLEKGLKGMGNVQKSAIITAIFQKRAVAGMNAILKAGSKEIRIYRKSLLNATGASKRMADEMRKTLTVRFAIFKSVVESIKLNVFKAISPILDRVLSRMVLIAEAVNVWTENNQTLIRDSLEKLLSTLKAIFQGIIIVKNAIIRIDKVTGGLMQTILALVIALKTLNLIMAINPIIFIVSAVIIAIGVLSALIEDFEGTVNKLKSFFSGIGKFFGNTLFAFAAKIPGIGEAPISSSTNVIKSQTTKEEKSTVDVNFNNLPKDAEVSSRGRFTTGFSFNVGSSF